MHLVRQLLSDAANASIVAVAAANSTMPEDGGGEDFVDFQEEEPYESDIAVLVLPRITACISFLAVICVALEAWEDIRASWKKKSMTSQVSSGNRIRSSTVTSNNSLAISRIQFFYQIPLLCHAIGFGLGTTPAPSEQDLWGAIGTRKTCEATGFILQFGGFGTIGWDIVLSTSYLLMVRHQMLNLLSLEKYYHMVIWPFVLGVCIYLLVKDMFNVNHGVCWIESYPDNCVGDECIRGEGANLMQTLASLMAVLHLVYSVTMMICIYCSIRGLENTTRAKQQQPKPTSADGSSMEDYSQQESITNRRRYSRAVGIQGILYASGMIITALPTAVYVVLFNATGIWSPAFGTFAISMTPLIGYVNFVVFMRGRSVEDCHTWYAKLLRKAHRWMWDYNWVCHCHCSCVPLHFGRRGGLPGNTSPTTQPKIGPQQQDAKPAPPTKAKAPHFSESEIPGATWTDKVITKKAVGRQWVSDLGQSDQSSVWWEQDRWNDNQPPPPPPEPAGGAILMMQPDETDRGDDDRWNSNNDSSQRRSLRSRDAPSKPERLESCAAVPDLGEAPPTKPERFVSELEDPNEQKECGTLVPIQPAEAPPSRPLRPISEIAPLDHQPVCANVEDEADASAKSKVKPDRFCRAAQQDESLSSSQNPPSKPLRVETEVEDDASDPTSIPSQLRGDAAAASTNPPSQPLRVISELEPSDNHNIALLSPHGFPGQTAAPSNPSSLAQTFTHAAAAPNGNNHNNDGPRSAGVFSRYNALTTSGSRKAAR